jgi:hypothetical protein
MILRESCLKIGKGNDDLKTEKKMFVYFLILLC